MRRRPWRAAGQGAVLAIGGAKAAEESVVLRTCRLDRFIIHERSYTIVSCVSTCSRIDPTGKTKRTERAGRTRGGVQPAARLPTHDKALRIGGSPARGPPSRSPRSLFPSGAGFLSPEPWFAGVPHALRSRVAAQGAEFQHRIVPDNPARVRRLASCMRPIGPRKPSQVGSSGIPTLRR